MPFAKKIAALKRFEKKVPLFIMQEIKANEAILIDMNIESQLYEKGINNEGVSIASYQPYQPATIEIKKQKGQPTNRVTLRDEGDFQRGWYTKPVTGGVEFDSHDWKNGNLADKYGEEIYGLTEENETDFRESYVRPRLQLELNNSV